MDNRLVNHDFPALGGARRFLLYRRQQESAEAGSKSDAYGGHVWMVHGIVVANPAVTDARGC